MLLATSQTLSSLAGHSAHGEKGSLPLVQTSHPKRSPEQGLPLLGARTAVPRPELQGLGWPQLPREQSGLSLGVTVSPGTGSQGQAGNEDEEVTGRWHSPEPAGCHSPTAALMMS